MVGIFLTSAISPGADRYQPCAEHVKPRSGGLIRTTFRRQGETMLWQIESYGRSEPVDLFKASARVDSFQITMLSGLPEETCRNDVGRIRPICPNSPIPL